MKNLYTIGTFIFFVFCSLSAAAQNAHGSSWSVYKDLDQVKIEQKVTTCSPQGSTDSHEYVFLKLTNKTSQPIHVTFRIESYFNGACTTCTNDEYVFTFNVPANGSVEPSCSLNGTNDRLAVYVKSLTQPNYSQFTKFELSEITIQ